MIHMLHTDQKEESGTLDLSQSLKTPSWYAHVYLFPSEIYIDLICPIGAAYASLEDTSTT